MPATKLKVSLCALSVLVGAMLVISAAPPDAARMVGIKTPENQAAAMTLRVVLMTATELAAHYRISMEASAVLGAQHFYDATAMDVLSGSPVPRA